MSTILFDPNGGELGLSYRGNVRFEQIPLTIEIIADLFYNLLKENIKPKDREFVFCIKIHPEEKDVIELMLKKIKLPRGVYIYECGGKCLFENRGPSGGIVTSMTFYIITKGDKE